MSSRVAVLVGTLTIASTIFFSTAPAVATTYCAAPATGCGGGDYPTLAGALSAASANAGADDVQLGAGAYTDGPWSYEDETGTNPVTIRGAGQLESQLVSAAGGPTLSLVNGNLENVTIYAPPAEVALSLILGTMSKSEVLVGTNGRGVDASAARIDQSAIVPLGSGSSGHTAVRADNSAIVNTSISTTNGIEVVNPPVAVRRSTIVTKGFGLQSGLTETSIADSQIVLNDPTAVGVEGVCDLTTGTIAIAATNLTVTGVASGGIAFRSIGGQLCGGDVSVSSSLVQGVATTADCAPGIGSASVTIDYSDADLEGPEAVTGACSSPVDGGGNFFADPKLAGLGVLQPLPRFDSPLVDAGDPAAPGADQPTDFAGLPRAVNGRRDIGAFEYGRRPPELSVATSPSAVTTADPVTFIATASDPDPGDEVSVGWSFDDGSTATGSEATHVFASGGAHTATATATDSVGLTTVRQVTVNVSRTGTGTGTDTGKKPEPDTSPPVTTGLRGPRQVLRGRPAKFKFGSSESGGTFECRVDRKPFRPCASPFRLMTKELTTARKHTFAVFAIDSAGNVDATPLQKRFTVLSGRPSGGARGVRMRPGAHAPVNAGGALVQLTGSKGCLVDRSKKGGSCGSARALDEPGPFMGSRAIGLSPDGKSVYVASSESDAIAIFKRDAHTGVLSQPRGTGGCIAAKGAFGCATAIGLDAPNSVAISADGKNVYATSRDTSTVTAFRRNPKSGALSQLPGGCISGPPLPGCASGRALAGPDVIVVSPDGMNAYVGSFFGNEVAVFDRDPASGALTQPAGAGGCVAEVTTEGCAPGIALKSPEGMAISSDGASVYVASALSNAVVVFARNTSGALTQPTDGSGCIVESPLAGCVTGVQLAGANAVAISPDDESVYVSSLLSNSVTSFTRSTTSGALAQKAGTSGCLIFLRAAGCSFGRALGSPEGIVVSPDGRSAYAAAFSSKAIAVLGREKSSGTVAQKPGRAGCLAPLSVPGCTHARALAGVSSFAFSPDGRYLYATAAESDAVDVFRRQVGDR